MTEEDFYSCMRRMAAGDQNALREVYEAYLKFIFAVCMSTLKHKESAEDVTSEFFIRLYKNAAKFDGRGTHRTWLATIARNMCIDYIRKNGRELAVLDEPERDDGSPREIADEAESGFEGRVETRLTLEAAMKVLSRKEQQIISMKTAGGLTFREISETLEMPQGTVSWHYNEAIKKLRRFLS